MEGNTAWMLISTALVLFMVPGLALFYGGMVRSKNVLNMLNDSWGRQSDAYFFNQQVVTASLDAQNRYVFEDFRNRGLTDLRENATLYEIRMGIQFEF